MRAALIVLSVALIAGCGESPATTGPVVGRVTLEVSGGIAGWDRIVTVDADGTVHV